MDSGPGWPEEVVLGLLRRLGRAGQQARPWEALVGCQPLPHVLGAHRASSARASVQSLLCSDYRSWCPLQQQHRKEVPGVGGTSLHTAWVDN